MYWKKYHSSSDPPVFTKLNSTIIGRHLAAANSSARSGATSSPSVTSQMRFPELCQQTTTISHKNKKLGNLAVKVPQHVVVSWFCFHLVGCLVEELTVPKPMVGKFSSWKDFLTWIQLDWHFLVKTVKPMAYGNWRMPAWQHGSNYPTWTKELKLNYPTWKFPNGNENWFESLLNQPFPRTFGTSRTCGSTPIWGICKKVVAVGFIAILQAKKVAVLFPEGFFPPSQG